MNPVCLSLSLFASFAAPMQYVLPLCGPNEKNLHAVGLLSAAQRCAHASTLLYWFVAVKSRLSPSYTTLVLGAMSLNASLLTSTVTTLRSPSRTARYQRLNVALAAGFVASKTRASNGWPPFIHAPPSSAALMTTSFALMSLSAAITVMTVGHSSTLFGARGVGGVGGSGGTAGGQGAAGGLLGGKGDTGGKGGRLGGGKWAP
mmetsp:Transcript_15404/g.25727  ORF Transcript_15404/g.25727 Transcript_15404/m.25727 type:complete len:203 (+) Transcript_15404:3-611(+)